jgi:hypothetical protein
VILASKHSQFSHLNSIPVYAHNIVRFKVSFRLVLGHPSHSLTLISPSKLYGASRHGKDSLLGHLHVRNVASSSYIPLSTVKAQWSISITIFPETSEHYQHLQQQIAQSVAVCRSHLSDGSTILRQAPN